MKKILFIAILVILVFCITACSENSSVSGDNSALAVNENSSLEQNSSSVSTITTSNNEEENDDGLITPDIIIEEE